MCCKPHSGKYINIKCAGATQIIVVDLLGKMVYQQPINITSTIANIKLSRGMYFVTVVTNEGRKTEKLIVE
jgi:Secretion system C-terminal sorting domain